MIDDALAAASGYTGLFTLCALAGLLIPIPEDVAVVFAGTQVHLGDVSLVPTLIVVGAGVLTRDTIAYSLGRLAGAPLLRHRWAGRLLGQHRLDWAQSLVQRRGGAAVLIARFAVGMKVPLFIVAGALRVPLLQFFAWDLLGAMVTVSVTVSLGYLFGPPLTEGTRWLLENKLALGVVLLLVAAWLGFRFLKNALAEARPDEAPLDRL